MNTGRYENLDGLRQYEVWLTSGRLVKVWAKNPHDARRSQTPYLTRGERVESVQLASRTKTNERN